MTQKQWNKLAQLVRDTPPESILKAAGLCDGHSILKPEAFAATGLPMEVVEALMVTHRSDGTPKGTIFVDGQPVRELRGVYGLDLLRYLANTLSIPYRSAMGRGFEAQNIRTALRATLGPKAAEPPP